MLGLSLVAGGVDLGCVLLADADDVEWVVDCEEVDEVGFWAVVPVGVGAAAVVEDEEDSGCYGI